MKLIALMRLAWQAGEWKRTGAPLCFHLNPTTEWSSVCVQSAFLTQLLFYYNHQNAFVFAFRHNWSESLLKPVCFPTTAFSSQCSYIMCSADGGAAIEITREF